MAEMTDLILDDNGLVVYNGDFLVGDATLQHQKHILLTGKGSAKNHPLSGLGIQDYLNDDLKPYQLEGDISAEFERDGMRVRRIRFNSVEDLEIEASYEN
jgi:hypothetical protein